MNVIEQLRKEEADRLLAVRKIPEFRPGDTVRVNVKIKEGERERVQAYEGVCIARAGQGVDENFTVRKISFGEGVERVFPVLSPMIDSIEVKRRGVVRRAKLYYLRGRIGKAARVAERRWGIDEDMVSAAPTEVEATDAEGATQDEVVGAVETPEEAPAAEAEEAAAVDEQAPEAEAAEEATPEAETEAVAEADAEAPAAGETEDSSAAPEDAEDEAPAEEAGDSDEGKA